jgi:hypothetical protein
LVLLLLLALPAVVYAKQITLAWDANSEPYLEGYKVYYKTGSSGNRVLSNYDGAGLTFVGEPYSGQPADSGFAIRLQDLPDPTVDPVTCTLDGLSDTDEYYFVVTAYADAGRLESDASNEASTAARATASGGGGGGGGGGCLITTAEDGGGIRVSPLLALLGVSACIVLAVVVAGRPVRRKNRGRRREDRRQRAAGREHGA